MLGMVAWLPVRWFGETLLSSTTPTPVPWSTFFMLIVLIGVQIVPIMVVGKCYRHVKAATRVPRPSTTRSNNNNVDKLLL